MEERLIYIEDIKDWLFRVINSENADFYLLYSASDFPNNPVFRIDTEKVFRRETSPISKAQGYLFLDKEIEYKLIKKEWLIFFKQAINSKNYTIAGLVNFIILTDRIGSLTDANHHELKMAVIEAIPAHDVDDVIENFIFLFNKEYKFNHNLTSTTCSTTANWIKLFRTAEYIGHFNNPIYLLYRIFKTFSLQIDILIYLTKLTCDCRSALLQYDTEYINFSATKLINFLKENPCEIGFYSAIIIYYPKQNLSFFSRQFGQFIIENGWQSAGSYFFQLIFNSNTKLNEEVGTIMQDEIITQLRNEIYGNNSNLNILTQFTWPEDYLALGGLLQQKNLNEKDEELNQYFLDCLVSELTQQLKNIKNAIPEMLSTYNSYSKEKWLGDPFKINSQYVQVYLNWSVMKTDKDNWLKFRQSFIELCLEIKVLLYASYFGKHAGLKLANQLLILLLNFPIVKEEDIPNINRFQELHKTFIKLIGLQWIYFSEQSKLIWNNKDYQPGFTDVELLFIINMLKSYPPQYKSTVNPLLKLIKEQQMTEWPLAN